jgi:hypothetical protein
LKVFLASELNTNGWQISSREIDLGPKLLIDNKKARGKTSLGIKD